MKIKGLALAAASALFISACNQDAPERMASLVAFKQTQPITSNWAVKVGKGTDGNFLKLNPDLAGDRIFASDYNGHVMAIDHRSGQICWHTQVDAKLTSGVGAGNGKVLVGSNNGVVFALRSSDGVLLWRRLAPGEVLATPTVNSDLAFIKTANGKLFVLDANTGRQVWQYQVQNPSLILRGDSSVATTGGLAVAGFADGTVVAFEKQTGRKVWERQLATPKGVSPVERMVDIMANLEVVGDTVYVSSYQGKIAALDIDNGKPRWQRDFSAHSGLTVGLNAVYVSDADSHVWAFARSNGQVLWHNDSLEGRDISGPALVQNTVVVGDKQGYVHCLDVCDGHFVARVKADSGRIDASPVVRKSTVFVTSETGELISYRIG